MHLNPYGEDALKLAADLANRRPASADDLAGRCAASGLRIDGPVHAADLPRTQAILDEWEKVVDTPDESARAALINQMLASAAAFPRLTDHAADGWHLHYRDDGQPLASTLFSLIAVGTALHMAGRGAHRLRRCALSECGRILVDTTRTGRQRYCSHPCANRDAVRRHRARQRAGARNGTRKPRPAAAAHRPGA
jgi:hypothetical protein